MKLQELIVKLQQIETDYPNADICFQTVNYRWENRMHVETVEEQFIIGVDYECDGVNHCMIGLSRRRDDEEEYKSRRKK